MAVKKLKNICDPRTHHCDWCGELAIWAALGCQKRKHSCETHKPELVTHWESSPKIPRDTDNGYRSEADYQTWMKA